MPNDMRDYRDYQKRKLSGSVDGRGIKVAAERLAPARLIHSGAEQRRRQ